MSEESIHHEMNQLADAVWKLTESRVVLRRYRKGGVERSEVCRIGSIFDEVVESLAGMEEGPTAGCVARSIPPLWLDALKWLNEIHEQTAVWIARHRIITCLDGADGKTTQAERFAALTRTKFRPKDHAHVKDYAKTVEKWAATGERLLAGSSRFGLEGECPNCETSRVRRRTDEGYWGDAHALQVSPDGAECLSCRARWEPNQLPFLGQLLGCPSPEELAKTA